MTRSTWNLSFLFVSIVGVLISEYSANAEKVPVSDCSGYQSPSGCKRGVDCQYEAHWTLSPRTSGASGDGDRTVTFNVTIRRPAAKASNFYTAVGFSEHQAMPDTDAVIGYTFNNNYLHVVDAYITPAGTNPPVVDEVQDVFNAAGRLLDDPTDSNKKVFNFVFTRKLDTGDKKQDVSLTECRYIFFMTSGGDMSGPNAVSFAKHDVTPDMSAQKVCLAKCNGAGRSTTAYYLSAFVLAIFVTIFTRF